MKKLFFVGIMTVAAGVGSAMIAGPAQADAAQDAVCGKGYQYGVIVTIGGQDWKVTGLTTDGQYYYLLDNYGRNQRVKCF
ncbi:hypothetical protein [Nocardia sp. NPDC049149]|uniref:hypothetical protein n=1 Tax=Nocardia sp. NPDC049149 TaxID=3364315 RepID=UPI00372228FD